ncbi:unnamed protein product [Bursaphelenchus xylophilus]|uniref:(pine wood nematode) hypothetical protein n=1 Tax=Bursaphelenchus xylophilus TaxID=6326 RepID=A0A1I7SMD7_BURXY|nr:unnamed protein product [Bursaphelenchus xylophilus]CAG9130136.1 unnamed protein product [Bursaphelenchus xylophilus]
MTTFGLEGKLALVTGAARGIGAATARKFAEHGANVILVDLRREELTETAEKLKDGFPNLNIEPEICDVSKKSEVDALAERLDKKFPHTIDILVNNAAILLVKQYLDVTDYEFENVLSVNLKSVHWVTQEFAKRAVAQKRPMSVINLSSITTNAGMLELSPYVAAKDGINGLTKVLARELGQYNIRVNAIKPGFVDTPMNTHLDEKYRAEVAKKTPLGRWAKPEEIANVIVFFASDLAGFCTCSFVDVNGGMSI